ncbi:hypothetical protein Tmar_0883 [Thermaerobacter marianensis DSM 12885]|uniref:DUF5667 domain-containing protein n=1 Tax=Thermaerobacter marianensis (strain ATCC 700841 / DSM 12885 / JCM 10246 / 7p75a) TaxID=644966 RepID=E6SJ02_THEM7|nr:hypothetical protein [Thermaerobacter marianensis]ADU50997.1 hypothetical protein Tmar_0883 [Thermaerobacter marianensis DSM 12885]
MGRSRWFRRAAAAGVLVWFVALPQLALASGDPSGATTATDEAGTVATGTAASSDGQKIDPGTLFAVRYYVQRLIEDLQLLVTLDASGDAKLLAEFAKVRADILADLDPQSEWYDRLAGDIAANLRLAQERVVQALAEGQPTDEAVAAIKEAVQRLQELAAQLEQATEAAEPNGSRPEGDASAGQDTGTAGDQGSDPASGDASSHGGETGQGALGDALQAAEEADLAVAAVAMIDPAVVRALRDQGYGYGQIALMYAAAQRISAQTGQDVTVAQVADLVAQSGGEQGGRQGFGKNLRAVLAQFGVERQDVKAGTSVAAPRRQGDGGDKAQAKVAAKSEEKVKQKPQSADEADRAVVKDRGKKRRDDKQGYEDQVGSKNGRDEQDVDDGDQNNVDEDDQDDGQHGDLQQQDDDENDNADEDAGDHQEGDEDQGSQHDQGPSGEDESD